MCTLILKETMSYYVNSELVIALFLYFLDATKAFDRIRYCRLFRKLLGQVGEFHRVLFVFY